MSQFQQQLDNNDLVIARIREQIRRIEPQREKIALQVMQRQDDGRSIHTSVTRLEDNVAVFCQENSKLEATIEEVPRILEQVSLPMQHPGIAAAFASPSGSSFEPFAAMRLAPAAIEVPLPYFQKLPQQLTTRLEKISERVFSLQAALASYSRPMMGVSTPSQIETVVRSQHAQFRMLAAQLAQAADRLEHLRDLAVKTQGVPAGMLSRPTDILGTSDPLLAALLLPQGAGSMQNLNAPGALAGLALANPGILNGQLGLALGGGLSPGLGGGLGGLGQGGLGGLGTGAGIGMMGAGIGGIGGGGGILGAPGGGMFGGNLGGGMFGANTGGGMFGGANTGGGLFGGANTGGGMFGANTGGGMFGANTGGGLFGGANTGGGMFGANTGGGMFGANTGGGMFGANTGGGMFGASSGGGGGLFGGAASSGGGMFGANTGGGMFGTNTGGGMFGGNTGGGMFGANTGGGGLFGNSGGGAFGAASSGGGLFGANAGGGGGLFGRR